MLHSSFIIKMSFISALGDVIGTISKEVAVLQSGGSFRAEL